MWMGKGGRGEKERRGSTGCIAAGGCGGAVAEGVCEEVAG